ncbi:MULTISPECIES: sulfur carrier protein ThiS [Microbulbifer]|uniref:sulfur carrier protein ThiS n=1 Tax=Microbulbifer TaxID=48073 RepID=UPI001E557B40|nr:MULTISPECIES: sulfur carrier protein ThiS [Microbulbifer]UHQ55185.1 sulfur carrier protein ThiS [Microbulbifer sp. YPW16]
MSKPIKIQVNGETQPLPEERNLDHFLLWLGYEGDTFAVALNGNFVPRGRYAETILNDGDALDVVAPVVGG